MSRIGLAFLTLAFSASAFAVGPISVGVKAGIPLTESVSKTEVGVPNTVFYPYTTYSDSRNYIVGPMIELRLPFGIGAEFDALYRPVNSSIVGTMNGQQFRNSTNSSTWEFPLLAKYRFPGVLARPYVEAGPSWRALGGEADRFLSTTGFTVGGGVELKALFLRVSPEFRYTRWSDKTPTSLNVIRQNQNQAQFLVGFSF